MSEEKTVKETECKCFCRSEGFRKFLITALGTFAGVYMALSLFAAIHKPPILCPCAYHHSMMQHQMYGQFRPHRDFKSLDKKLNKEHRGEFKGEQRAEKPDVDD